MQLNVALLGFSPSCVEIVSRIKKFPEYGMNNGVYLYHIQVDRNSLSYGPDYVVEIPDPYDDGYRTYKDGFQAVPGYSTTISDYEEWFLTEAEHGSFNVVINCLNSDDVWASKTIEKLKTITNKNCVYIETLALDDVIAELRYLLDGGQPWIPVNFDEEFLKTAKNLWHEANLKMRSLHIMKRSKDIESRGNRDLGKSLDGYPTLKDMIKPEDIETLNKYVVGGNSELDYKRQEVYVNTNKCLVINHEMLDWFFSGHCVEDAAATYFCVPDLITVSTKYINYDSDKSIPLPEENYQYAFEYVVEGTLRIKAPNGEKQRIQPGQAYGYSVNVNAPMREFLGPTKTMIFYYEKENK